MRSALYIGDRHSYGIIWIGFTFSEFEVTMSIRYTKTGSAENGPVRLFERIVIEGVAQRGHTCAVLVFLQKMINYVGKAVLLVSISNNTVFPSHHFVLNKFCQLLSFKLQDRIWRGICEIRGWQSGKIK